MGNKICIIGVYFGCFPGFIDLWLKSCESNKGVDFLIVCDNSLSTHASNIIEVRMTLKEFKQLTENKLGRKIVLEKAYKCCDYKPLYGLILEDYVSKYDYWGFCDFDMLFGDILSMADKYKLYEYDKFLPLGHLSLIKNTKEINRLLVDSKIKESKFSLMIQTDETIQFDELSGGVNDIFEKEGKSLFRKRIFADISRLWKRIKLAERYKDSDDKNYNKQVFYWEDGKCFRSYLSNGKIEKEEFLYIHIKKRKYIVHVQDRSNIRQIIITPNRLVCNSQPQIITKQLIEQMNPFKGRIYEFFEEKFLGSKVSHIKPSNV